MIQLWSNLCTPDRRMLFTANPSRLSLASVLIAMLVGYFFGRLSLDPYVYTVSSSDTRNVSGSLLEPSMMDDWKQQTPTSMHARILIVSGDGDPANEHSITLLETIPLIKSILLYASCDLHFLFFTGGGSDVHLKNFFAQLERTKHQVSYTLMELDIQSVATMADALDLHYEHHSGIWGLAKFFLADLLPADDLRLSELLVIDTDFIFGSDIADLWAWGQRNVFRKQLMHASTIPRPPHKDGGFGLCSCISFFNLPVMRRLGWTGELGRQAMMQFLPKHGDKVDVQGDQVLNVAIARFRPDLFTRIPQSWALNQCQNFFNVLPAALPGGEYSNPSQSSKDQPEGLFFGAIHFNCEKYGYYKESRKQWDTFRQAVVKYRTQWLNGDYSRPLNCFEIKIGL